ncbi:hypothetical protein AMECASPLE_014141, partial [Ameca splendens]
MNAPVSTGTPSEVLELQPRRRVSADQIHAAHREARMEARQVLKEEAQTEGLLKSRKAVLPSEIRRRERSVDDTNRAQPEDMDWQIFSPERRRRSHEEEDWDHEWPRERGRERKAQKIRERVGEHPSTHDSQEEKICRSMQPAYSSVLQQHRQDQSMEPMHHQEHQLEQHELPEQKQYEVRKVEHTTQIQQDLQKEHQHSHLRKPQDNQRQSLGQYEFQTKEPPNKQELFQIQHQDPQAKKEMAPQKVLSQHQSFDSAVYLQRGSSLPQAKHRSMEISGGPKPKIRTRSMSDIGVSQHSTVYQTERAGVGREAFRIVPPPGLANGEVGTLDTRVSVAQLRHSYLENANRKPELETTKADLAAKDVEPASSSIDGDKGPRRPRRYITPGDSRTSERFRTQPITSAERLESDRSCLSPSQLQDAEGDEEKVDERAKMSVAAKRSLFRELEKTSEGAVPKPRSRNVAVERRLRRVKDRSHTQPVTNKEVVNASSDTTTSSQPEGAPTSPNQVCSPTIASTNVTSISIQASSQPGSTAQEQETEMQDPQKHAAGAGGDKDGQDPLSEEPDFSTLSLCEKMALFNRLAHPTAKTAEGSRGDTRQRRANARFQTQPITQEEVEQETVTSAVCNRDLDASQGEHVKIGGKIKLEPLSVSLVRSVAAVTSQASVTTAPSSANIHQERAPRYFSLTKRGHQGHNEGEPDFSPILPGSPEKAGAPPALPSSSVCHRQQKEVLVEGWRGRQEEEEKAGGREQGGAREDSIQEKLLSSDRDRGDQLQHPKHSAEPSLWRGEQEPQTSRRAADSQEGGEKGRGKGGQLREATAAYSSSKQEQKGSQGGISGVPDHPGPLKPLIAKVSSRTVSYISSGHHQQQNVVQPPQTLPKPTLYIQAQSYSQPPPTYPKPFTHSLQTQPKPPGLIQSLPKPYPQALKSQSASADHLEDFSRSSVHSGDLLSPTEPGDQLSDSMSTKQMSIKERVALLKKSGEEDWRNRINKKQEVVKVASADQQPQQWEMDQTSQKKEEGVVAQDQSTVSGSEQLWKAGEETEAQMTIEERKQMISTREDAWKSKGKGAANDSTQYTVAARMVKKGLAASSSVISPILSPVSTKLKSNTAAVNKPQE